MAKQARTTQPVAMSRIEHGVMKDGKNVPMVFEQGDIVEGLDGKTMKTLMECGAVKQLAAESPADK